MVVQEVNDDESDDLNTLVTQIPSSASKDYGEPFYDVFKKSNFDFFIVDPELFSPAVVVLSSLRTGELPRAKASRLPASTTDSIPLKGYGGLISTGLTSLRPVGTVNDGNTIGVCTLVSSVRMIPPIVIDTFLIPSI